MPSLSEINTTSWGNDKSMIENISFILANFNVIRAAGLDQAVIATATAKTAPAAADTLPLSDPADSNALKKLSFSNLSAALSNPTATITYNANGTVNTIAEIGTTYTLAYNANGTINTISDGTTTRTCAYTNGNLTSVA